MKTFILGSRSGTSTLARLLQAAGMDLWTTVGATEPPYMQAAIYKNAGTKTGEKKIKKAFDINDSWNLAKLPEFSLCLPLINELYPNSRFILLARSLRDRMESTINMGWHYQISERVEETKSLQKLIEETTGDKVSSDPVTNATLYFMTLDILTTEFLCQHKNTCVINYDDFNRDFPATMRVIANFLGISFFQNIDTWKKIKAIPQQAGRWKLS